MPVSEKPILVYLAGGVQGGAVVRAALRRGLKVRALVRSRAQSTVLAALGVELAQGDLDDAASLRAAGTGIDHAVLQVPTAPPDVMRAMAQNALAASKAAGLRAIVLRLASASRPAPCVEPSFVASHAIAQMARQSGMVCATVWPTLYLDNLLKPSARKDIMEHGVFAPPLAAEPGIAWTSADDCAEAALMLLGHGGNHRIAGSESLTGDALAARLTVELGRPIVYRAQPLADFEREVDDAMGPGMGRRVASKFRYFAAHPAQTDEILSRPFKGRGALAAFRPESAAAWLRRHRAAFGA